MHLSNGIEYHLFYKIKNFKACEHFVFSIYIFRYCFEFYLHLMVYIYIYILIIVNV